jgi:hypothetical protein
MPKSKNQPPPITDNTDNKDSGWMSFFNAGYSGTAMYGKFIAIKNFIIILIIYIIVIFSVNSFLYNKEDIYGENIIKGKINDSTCKKYTNYSSNSNSNGTTNWDCSLNIAYNIDNTNYEKKNHKTNSSTYYSPNSIVDLRYNKYDKNDINLDTWSYDYWGNIIILFSSIIFILAAINLISVFLFPPAAAATGAAALGGTVAHGISSGWNSGFNHGR